MTTDDQPDGETRIVKGWHDRDDEEFEVGDIYKHPLGRTVTETDNVWLTNVTMNLNPMHCNEAYAADHGDTLFGESEMIDKRDSGSRDHVGIVTTELRGYSQDGDRVISLERTPMVLKREHARPSAAKPPGWPDGIGTQPGPGS